MTHDATERARALTDLVELLEDHGHTVRGWEVHPDGSANLDVEPEGIGGGTTK